MTTSTCDRTLTSARKALRTAQDGLGKALTYLDDDDGSSGNVLPTEALRHLRYSLEIAEIGLTRILEVEQQLIMTDREKPKTARWKDQRAADAHYAQILDQLEQNTA